MNSEILSIIINSIIFLLFLIASITFISIMKFDSKGYKFMFILYIIFWIPIMLVREYRGKIQNLIDPNFLWIALSAYGFVGIFLRIFADYLSLKMNSRKIVLYFAISIMFITFTIFVFYPTTVTNVLQTVGIGVGASMIGIYELMFKEQYSKNKSYLTVSILAIPPLLADFITSPIQSLVTIVSTTNDPINNNQDVNLLKLLWIIGIVFIVVTFIMLFFLKEDRKKIAALQNKNLEEIEINKSKKTQLKLNNKYLLSFILFSILGTIVAFIKFSNSGAIAITTLETLGKSFNINVSSFQAYISLVFSIFQLMGSASIYFFMKKKKNFSLIFSFGIFLWIIYHICISFIHNPIFYFAFSSINGFAYGVLYNVLLGYILSSTFNTHKITPMGMYQSILAIGIFSSSFFTTFLKKQIYSSENIFLVNWILMAMCFGVLAFYFLMNHFYNNWFHIKRTKIITN